MELVQPPSNASGKKDNEVEVFTTDEVAKFAEAAQSKYSNGQPIYRNGSIFLLMLNTGLRIGEACALKWENYDEEAQTITIRSSIILSRDENGKRVVEDQDSVKTRHSQRVLNLNAKAIAALPSKSKGKYIFGTRDDKPLRSRSIQNTLDSILERAGIPHKSTHVFRHTFASRLFEKGYEVRVVSELLGHTNVNTTYNTYIHVIKQQKAKAMEAIEDMY